MSKQSTCHTNEIESSERKKKEHDVETIDEYYFHTQLDIENEIREEKKNNMTTIDGTRNDSNDHYKSHTKKTNNEK